MCSFRVSPMFLDFLLSNNSETEYRNVNFFSHTGCIDDQSRGDDKQSGYVQIHERAKTIVESIVDEFCLIFSFIKAGDHKSDSESLTLRQCDAFTDDYHLLDYL